MNAASFRRLQPAEWLEVSRRFANIWDAATVAQQNEQLFAKHVYDFLGRPADAREVVLFYGTRMDQGGAHVEECHGHFLVLQPGIIVFQSLGLWDWPISGLVTFNDGELSILPSHPKAGVRFFAPDVVAQRFPQLETGSMVMTIWSGSGHSGFGCEYSIDPDRWRFICAWMMKWLTPPPLSS